jgi:hypothetical protein
MQKALPVVEGASGFGSGGGIMMTGRTGSRDLETWLAAIQADDGQPDLRSLATGIRNDQQAVTNGLTLDWSSGKVEGTVNIKDQDDQTPDVRPRRLRSAPQTRDLAPSVTAITEFAAEPVIPHGDGVRVVVDLAIEMEQPCLPSGTGGRWQGERST